MHSASQKSLSLFLCALATLGNAILVSGYGHGEDKDRFLREERVFVPCATSAEEDGYARKLATWTALNNRYKAIASIEVSPYDYSVEDFPEEVYGCVVDVRPCSQATNGVACYSVKIDVEKLAKQISRPWQSVQVHESGKRALMDKRARLSRTVSEVKRLFADYPSRLYNMTRVGMFGVGKSDKTDSSDTVVNMTYEAAFCVDEYKKTERRLRSVLGEFIIAEKTVGMDKYVEWRISEVYEAFWKESGYDQQTGYRIVSFLDEKPNESIEIRMFIVPAQIHRALRESLSSDSVVEYSFRIKDEATPIRRMIRTEISFWRLPYTDFSDSETRPIEFRNWMSMEIENGKKSFSTQEISQSFKLPAASVTSLDHCDIRVYSGEAAKSIFAAPR